VKVKIFFKLQYVNDDGFKFKAYHKLLFSLFFCLTRLTEL